MAVTSSFSQWVKANRVVFGLLLKGRERTRREDDCLELTRRNLLLHNDSARSHYIEGYNLDAMVSSAWMWGYNYLWVQVPGHYILDKPGIQKALDDEIKQGFFLLGHILDYGEKYYAIHHQSIIVNLKVWSTIGKPFFGEASIGEKSLHVPSRSADNFHDSHTPTWIGSTGTKRTYLEQSSGWNYLSHGLDSGVRLAPFSPAIRARKGYLYPEEDCGYYFKLGDYRRRAREWAEAAWVVNTEELATPNGDFQGPVDTIIGVASGLKLYLILLRFGFTEATAIHYVDSSRATLNFKEWLVRNWDGKDYVKAVSTWLASQSSDTHLQKDFSEAKLIDGAVELYAQFDGEANFVRHWKEFRGLRHTFNHIDLLTTDHRKLLKMIPRDSEKVVLWFSNVFHSYYTHSLLSHEEGEKLYLGWINMLRERNGCAFLLCKDQYHVSVANRVSSITVDRSAPFLQNRYFPPEIVEWFGRDFEDSRGE